MENKIFRKGLVVGVIFFTLFSAFAPSSFGSFIIKKDNVVSNTNFNNGTLSGYVNDSFGNPIERALVRVNFHGTYEENYSDSTGYYYVDNISICWCLKNTTCSKEGYKTEWALLAINESTTYDFVLTLTSNNPPNPPIIKIPSTITVGKRFKVEATVVDPDGDDVYIRFNSSFLSVLPNFWLGPLPSGFTYIAFVKYQGPTGNFTLGVQAKDVYDDESEWTYVQFNVTKVRTYNNPIFSLLINSHYLFFISSKTFK
jgi:hypothetical protein